MGFGEPDGKHGDITAGLLKGEARKNAMGLFWVLNAWGKECKQYFKVKGKGSGLGWFGGSGEATRIGTYYYEVQESG